ARERFLRSGLRTRAQRRRCRAVGDGRSGPRTERARPLVLCRFPLSTTGVMVPGPPWDVIHCVFSIAIGGQEMVILSLAERADRALFTPRVLCLQGAGELAPRFEAAGIPVDVLDRESSG